MIVAIAVLGGLRFALGFTFLLAGSAKLGDVRGLLRAVDGYQMIPKTLVPVFSVGLIALEVGVGLGLLAGLPGALIGSAAALLALSFVVAIGVNLHRGRTPLCGCFGSASDETISSRSLIRVALLSACAAAVAAGGVSGWEGQEPGLRALLLNPSPTPLWEAAIGVFLLTLAQWLLAVPDLRLALFDDPRLKGGA